ncbi:MAG: type III pantothenate kinase [Alphaproteobacteria bacterium]|nr:type III pantothenate kinase [Alphaproteobacteria bacterium]
MNYLIIDIGNTNIDFVNFNNLTNMYSNKFTVDTSDILNGRLGNINKKIKKNFYKGALCSSVVPNAFNKLKKMLKSKNVHLNEIKQRNLDLPIKIKINKPKQVGSDRVVNAIAAFKIYKRNSIIIDFGTATTFDVMVKNTYIGGMITPGINLSLKVLKEATAKLPLIKLKKTNKYIGKDTVSAMNNGMYWGYIGLIKELVKKIIKETKKKYLVIFTGGLANIFFSSFPFKDKVIDQQITLKGIAETLKFNLKNI